MSLVKNLVSKIRKTLQDAGKPSLAKYQQGYMKDVVKFYGIRIPETRKMVMDSFSDEIKALTASQALEVAHELIASEYAEDKVRPENFTVQTNTTSHVLKPNGTEAFFDACWYSQVAATAVLIKNLNKLKSSDVKFLEKMFDNNHIYDWCVLFSRSEPCVPDSHTERASRLFFQEMKYHQTKYFEFPIGPQQTQCRQWSYAR
jgi:ribosomal protein L20A (L18A)